TAKSDYLSRTWLDNFIKSYVERDLNQLFHQNFSTPLVRNFWQVKSPKIYIRDSGLLHRLAGIMNMDELKGNILIGASWEGYAIEQIAQIKQEALSMFFYRTHNGAELDLVLVKKNKVYATVEIKTSSAAMPPRGFYESNEYLKPAKSFVITPSGDPFPDKNGTLHCSLKHFLLSELPKI
ncbi:MAG: DUF4143 domain-containing protein, partial [Niabella sp.]